MNAKRLVSVSAIVAAIITIAAIATLSSLTTASTTPSGHASGSSPEAKAVRITRQQSEAAVDRSLTPIPVEALGTFMQHVSNYRADAFAMPGGGVGVMANLAETRRSRPVVCVWRVSVLDREDEPLIVEVLEDDPFAVNPGVPTRVTFADVFRFGLAPGEYTVKVDAVSLDRTGARLSYQELALRPPLHTASRRIVIE